MLTLTDIISRGQMAYEATLPDYLRRQDAPPEVERRVNLTLTDERQREICLACPLADCDALPCLRRRKGSLESEGEKPMTKGEIEIGSVLIAVATGRVTVAQLKKYLALRQREVDAVGAKNMPSKTLRRMAAIESALKRIEREQAKYRN